MSLLTLVVLAAAKLDDANLVALPMALDGGNDFGRANIGGADRYRGTGADEQHLIEFDTGALIRVEFLDTHHSTFLDAVLFTARGNHGIHGSTLQLGSLRGRKRAVNSTARRPINQTGSRV